MHRSLAPEPNCLRLAAAKRAAAALGEPLGVVEGRRPANVLLAVPRDLPSAAGELLGSLLKAGLRWALRWAALRLEVGLGRRVRVRTRARGERGLEATCFWNSGSALATR